ncbi:MAG: leucine-rich repeat domain-containing protein [Paramuribaculum sp.]|nr:leucine-rich repeat domain-containing protein [Paramuribaculum sp.]
MKHPFLAAILCLCTFIPSLASHRSVSITQAGSLSRAINSSEVRALDSLTVAGPMNLSDLRVVWDGAYYGSLKFLDISKALFEGNKIPDYAFYNPDKQKGGIETKSFLYIDEIILPDNIVEFGKYAFRYTYLTKMDIPQTLRKLGTGAFFVCNLPFDGRADSLFRLPEGIEEIPDSCFTGSVKGNTFHFPSTLKRLGDYNFSNCVIKHVTFPENMEEIGDHVFESTYIENAHFAGNCRKIGISFLSDCQFLTEANLPNDIDTINSSYLAYTFVKSIEIPSSVKVIKTNAFWKNGSLKSITFNEGLEEIEENAFNHSVVNSITLPSTLERIGQYAIIANNIYCLATTPPKVESGAPSSNFTLYVLPGLKSVYESAPGWSAATEIIEIAAEQFPVAGIKTIDAAADTEITVTSAEGGILVNSIKNGPVNFSVYSTDGTLIHSATANPEAEVKLPAGIYVVATADEAVKVAVR